MRKMNVETFSISLIVAGVAVLPFCHADDTKTPWPTLQQQIDSNYGLDHGKKSGAAAHRKLASDNQKENLPRAVLRDRAFKNAELSDAVQTWDQLDRDMLYVRASSYTLDELVEKYPNLPKKKLERLRKDASK